MACNRVTAQLDAYMDGELTGPALAELEAHVHDCADCSRMVTRERKLQQALHDLQVPDPDPDYFERALSNAAREGERDHRHRWWGYGFGSAVAASLALWLVIGVFFKTPDIEQPPGAGVAGVTIAMHENHTVNLVFASASELQDATLTVLLPPGIEVAGYGGRQEIRWRTSLRKGKNVLPLELVALDNPGGELVARLEHDDKQKTFRVKVTVI